MREGEQNSRQPLKSVHLPGCKALTGGEAGGNRSLHGLPSVVSVFGEAVDYRRLGSLLLPLLSVVNQGEKILNSKERRLQTHYSGRRRTQEH